MTRPDKTPNLTLAAQALRMVEYCVPGHGMSYCPVCRGSRKYGHSIACELGLALDSFGQDDVRFEEEEG